MKNIQYYSHLCACECGGQMEVKSWHKWEGIPKYVKGHNKSKNNFKHGESYTKLYTVYQNMKQRILNINSQAYKDYGGRGITVCPEWTNDYTVFRDWALNNGYQEGLEIDRRDNNGNYEPSNCRWVSSKINSQNRRSTKLSQELVKIIKELYTTDNYTQKELAKEFDVSIVTIQALLYNKIWKNIEK